MIVGTSFQVHPFCDLIHYKQPTATILAINQTPLFYNNLIIFRSESRNDICRINDKGVTEWKNLNQKRKMIAGALYFASDPELVADRKKPVNKWR